jgi:hypothetical protein
LSGTFLPLRDIVGEVESGEISEEWSVEILKSLLTSTNAAEKECLGQSAPV